jgi:AbrB family looped-hinge helix DNA binding protein
MSSSILSSKGQTTIPKDIRKWLNLHPGDRLEFVIDEDGRDWCCRQALTRQSWRGCSSLRSGL